MKRLTLPKIGPTVKLVLLLAFFALFNLAPKKEDCCGNEEDGDDPVRLFYLCVEGDPAVKNPEVEAGGTITLKFKQTDCGNSNSTFLLPRPWDVRPGAGLSIAGQSASGSNLSVTFKATEHPELYKDFSVYDTKRYLLTCSFVGLQVSGVAEMIKGELELRTCPACIDIKIQEGVDVPWTRSNTREPPDAPRIEVRPPTAFYQEVNKEHTWFFAVYNRGKKNLDIYSISLEEQGDKWFRLDPSEAPPYYLAAGKSFYPHITCKPLYAGTKGAILVITSNDPTFPVVRTSVKATGYVN